MIQPIFWIESATAAIATSRPCFRWWGRKKRQDLDFLALRQVFTSLPENKRLVLATALVEGQVTNNRLCELTDQHSRDITFLLGELVEDGFLESEGQGHGTYYTISGMQSRKTTLFEDANISPFSTPDKEPEVSQ